ncbi:MAG: hypothetical protein WDK96_00510 [Candidatus Paceibacterota bacterium]|jgi:hypothetical protein
MDSFLKILNSIIFYLFGFVSGMLFIGIMVVLLKEDIPPKVIFENKDFIIFEYQGGYINPIEKNYRESFQKITPQG